jgi:thymidylate synthase ThyX
MGIFEKIYGGKPVIPDVSILADSINGEDGNRLTTFLLGNFPKCLLAEVNTHRMLSKNAASSRAIPIAKLIEQVQKNPFIPQWTGHAKGMVGTSTITSTNQRTATLQWLDARDEALSATQRLSDLGIAKQNANRLLEPWMMVPVIVSGTEWANFFRLRTAPDAQPEFRSFAIEMQRLMKTCEPKMLENGDWHIPLADPNMPRYDRIRQSVAMCARGSYGSFNAAPDLAKDIELHDRLKTSGHWSPFEHQAKCIGLYNLPYANYRGWQSYRNTNGF